MARFETIVAQSLVCKGRDLLRCTSCPLACEGQRSSAENALRHRRESVPDPGEEESRLERKYRRDL